MTICEKGAGEVATSCIFSKLPPIPAFSRRARFTPGYYGKRNLDTPLFPLLPALHVDVTHLSPADSIIRTSQALFVPSLGNESSAGPCAAKRTNPRSNRGARSRGNYNLQKNSFPRTSLWCSSRKEPSFRYRPQSGTIYPRHVDEDPRTGLSPRWPIQSPHNHPQFRYDDTQWFESVFAHHIYPSLLSCKKQRVGRPTLRRQPKFPSKLHYTIKKGKTARCRTPAS